MYIETVDSPDSRNLLDTVHYTGLDINKHFQRKNVNIFLPINFNIFFGCSKEPSHLDRSFEYPQHMFCLRNKKIKFSLHTLNLSPAVHSFK